MIHTTNRFFGAAIGAATVTAALFWVMTALIRVEDVQINTEPRRNIVLDVFVAPPERPVETIRPVVERKPVVKPEPLPEFSPGNGDEGVLRVRHEETTIRIDPGPGNLSPEPQDGDAVPLVRVPPQYPPRALARGIEGRVLVEFTISRVGTVEDPRIIAFDPSPIFNQAALDAIQSWRYEPKRVNGRAVAQPGQQIVIPFKKDQRRE